MNSHQTDLRGRIIALIGTDVDLLIEAARDAAVEADKLRAAINQLERRRKIILAEQKEEHRARLRREGERASEARLEDLARCSKAYADHCDAMLAAEEQAAEAEAEKWAAKNAVDYALSLMATLRSEQRAYGSDAQPASAAGGAGRVRWSEAERAAMDEAEFEHESAGPDGGRW